MLFPNNNNNKNKSDNDFKRLEVAYTNKSNSFLCTNTNYKKQYAHVYASRLKIMTELLTESVKHKWGDKYKIKKICNLREDESETCVIIGTLFKHQELKPSILREISEEVQTRPQPQRTNFADKADKIILEDELQRITLIGNINKDLFVTGIVIAILGFSNSEGQLIVEDYIFYENAPQTSLIDLKEKPLLVILSGLNQSSNNTWPLSLDLLQQWFYGNLKSFNNQKDWESSSIVRIIIAGNSVSAKAPNQANNYTKQKTIDTQEVVDAIKLLDNLLFKWLKSVFIDLMSGEFDPANHMLPQQPLHHCILPKCHEYKNFQCVTNPYKCELAGRTILGTSGQNIYDILRYTNLNDPLTALKSTLLWNHISPTSPDTLPCYPYYNDDPFIIDEQPHIYFAGNMPKYQTELYTRENGNKTRLICIPSFSDTQSIVVVDLSTLNCKMLSFKMNLFENSDDDEDVNSKMSE